MSYVSDEAEMSVIGAMLLSERACDVALRLVSPQDFVGETRAAIFRGLSNLRRRNLPLDFTLIRDELGVLDRKPHWEIGEDSQEREAKERRIVAIMRTIEAAMEFVPGPGNVEFYCEMVKGLAWKRARKADLDRLLSDFDDAAPEALMADVKAFGESWHVGMSGGLTPWAEIEVQSAEKGVPTGFGPAIDALTRVGWVCGQLNVVSAYHKGGKTTFKIGSFRECVKAGRRAVYATFADLNPSQLKRRALKQECGIGSYPKGRADLAADYSDALEIFNDEFSPWAGAYVYNAREHGRDVETFYAKMLVEHSRKPIDIIFCDYIQKVGSREVPAKNGKTAQMEHVSDVLDELAGRLDVPIVVGSQVTKGPDGEWVTKYARALEEDAGFVLRVIRENETNAKVICKFNRFGPQDVEVPMDWDDRRVCFVPRPVTHVAVNQ